ncbi:AAA family ATPase [Streptomyces sp. SID13031]|uniref:AAA family ATPase n=1 Tax=Streptomyces sp. SID13031 TaxID=2706046 RepID=UPI0013C9C8E8|nr:AAA family ATPase [Streptomyces sp. SID13031]NEA34347.1 kinase [Streptomyces sp. SID13031]
MPSLIVIRGNSGSGKSSVAEGIRAAYGPGVAWIEQDHIRRIIFAELDQPDGANITAIGQLARLSLDRGFVTVVEGIMPTVRYGEMLTRLAGEHDGPSSFFYLDVPFEETSRRHLTRAKATAFSVEEMLTWYQERDLLGRPDETVIDETSSLAQTIESIAKIAGL